VTCKKQGRKMKAGDLVKWIGYPGASIRPNQSGPPGIGLIVKVWRSSYDDHDLRIDVLWGGGKRGKGLYPQTVEVIRGLDPKTFEVINESR
jgi:hypothetical protein